MELPELATIHDHYLALDRQASGPFAGRAGGKLLLRAGLEGDGIAVIIAASVAGFASLSIEPDPERLRQALRLGFCDFVVSHLDESLRILKNELRRGRCVAVALTADPVACVRELSERGLQPDLVSLGSIAVRETQVFVERGAFPVSPGEPDPALSLVNWSRISEGAPSMSAISRAALDALDASRSDTPARRRWLEQGPAFLGRAFGHRQCARMTASEIFDFRASVRAWAPAITLCINGFAVDVP